MTYSFDSPIFIVGLPRTGSTLWLNIITRNPAVFGIGEMLVLTPLWRRDLRYFLKTQVGDLLERENVKRMVDLMFSGKRIPGISSSFWRYEVQAHDSPELKERIVHRLQGTKPGPRTVFQAIIEEMPRHHGFSRCCVKFPVFVNHVPELVKWYPRCRVVHIIRDPRAMAISRALFRGERRLRQRQLTILFASLQYVWTSKVHDRLSSLPNYGLFRYEDLLANPAGTIRDLCDFVEIEFRPQMLEPYAGQASSLTGTKSGGFNRKPGTHWTEAISPFEKCVITALTRSSMRRFGYDPENHPIFLDSHVEPRPA